MSFFNANKWVENSPTLHGYQKLYTGITWFSDNVQAVIFAEDRKGWVKKERKFVFKNDVLRVSSDSRTCLKELIWNG